MDYLILAGIAGFAGILQGVTGFGFGLTAIALLVVFYDIKTVAVMLVLANLSLNVFIFLKLRGHFSWDRLLPFVCGSLVGVPVGVLGLAFLSAEILRVIMGGILIFAGIQPLLPNSWLVTWPPYCVGIPLGVFSGVLSGAFGNGGPPAVAYVASQDFDRHRNAVSIQVLLGISGTVRLACLLGSGLLTAQLACYGMFAAIAAVIGAWGGLCILRRLSDREARIAVALLLCILGIWYFISA